MIKFNEIKVGDYLMADNDGDKLQGEVTNLNGNEKQVCLDTGVQEFWYEMEQLNSIPLDETKQVIFLILKFGTGMNTGMLCNQYSFINCKIIFMK